MNNFIKVMMVIQTICLSISIAAFAVYGVWAFAYNACYSGYEPIMALIFMFVCIPLCIMETVYTVSYIIKK